MGTLVNPGPAVYTLPIPTATCHDVITYTHMTLPFMYKAHALAYAGGFPKKCTVNNTLQKIAFFKVYV